MCKGIEALVWLRSEKLCDLKQVAAPLWALFVSCVEQVRVALIGSHKLKCPQRQEKEVKQGSPGWEEVVRVGVEVRITV